MPLNDRKQPCEAPPVEAAVAQRRETAHGPLGASLLAARVFALLMLACLLPQAVSAQVCATPGMDGPATLTGVINTYYPGTASASAGATSITIGAARVGGASVSISAGDLLLVIQMQDAAINSTNTSSYGDGVAGDPGSGSTSLNNSGLYEYVMATNAVGLGGGTVTIRGTGAGNGLTNDYTNAAASGTQGQRRFQIVRVPQYSSATLTSGLAAAPWDGTTGGILAFDVAGALALGGATVSVSGMGFRGGGGRQLAGSGSGSATDYRLAATNAVHGAKGEGVAGTPRYVYDAVTNTIVDTGVEGYPNGSQARGAPATAGGGGTDSSPSNNEENSGGGGGANGGGGGMGGNTWRANSVRGGFGGVAFPGAATRIALGSGGGAGSRNNTPGVVQASSGAAGGGIVMLRVGSVSGAATINADGADAYNDTLNDGGGGGGAGGSVVIITASGGLGGLSVSARGGRGGDAWRTQAPGGTPGNRHGPGGGGGGGVILLSSAAATNVSGGANGTTTTALDAYGAAAGAAGLSTIIAAGSIPGVTMGAQCLPSLTVTKTTSTATVNNTPSGANATYSVVVSNAANRAAATALSVSDTLPAGFTYNSTTSVTLAGGATRSPVADPTAGDAVPAWGVFSIPGSGSVTLEFVVNIAAGVTGTMQNPATAAYLDPTRTTATGTTSASYDPASSTGEDVTVVAPPSIQLQKSCTSPANCETAQQPPGTELTYTITFTNTGGRAAQSFFLIDVIPFSVDAANSLIVLSTEFKVGSMTFTQGTTALTLPAGGLKYFSDAINYPPPAPPWNPTTAYTPIGSYDPNVTYIGWQFNGTMAPGSSGSVTFTVRIR